MGGFYARLEALADPSHPDRDDALDWMGDFDKDKFDRAEIIRRLDRVASRKSRKPSAV